METREHLTKVILELCKKAMDGCLNIEDFHQAWPEAANEDSFFKKVHDDVEDAVEHLPGNWVTGKPKYKAWESSNAFMTVYLDSLLLGSERNTAELARYREEILKEDKLSRERIHDNLTKYLRGG